MAVLTGAGRAFSAGGDFGYLDELSKDDELRHQTLMHGRQIVTGMVACRLPIVAAVNGPAVGLGCSLVALSDIVFMAASAHLADPHVLLGLVAADGGPVVWPLLTSLQLAKEYALTGDRIPAERAAAIGLANHVCPDDEVLDQAMACAHKIARLPEARWRTRNGSSTSRWSGRSSPHSTSRWRRRTAPSRRRSSAPTSTGCCSGGRDAPGPTAADVSGRVAVRRRSRCARGLRRQPVTQHLTGVEDVVLGNGAGCRAVTLRRWRRSSAACSLRLHCLSGKSSK